MQSKLYHYLTGFPGTVTLPAQLAVEYTQHAKRAAADDRYGAIPLRNVLDMRAAKVIEIERIGERTVKVVVRMPLDNQRDICYAIALGGIPTVKTVWINLKSDVHRTIDLSRYVKVNA